MSMMPESPAVVVVPASDDESVRRRAEELAARIHVPLSLNARDMKNQGALFVVVEHDRLVLREGIGSQSSSVNVDFSPLANRRRRPTRRQPLIRAIGDKATNIMDATAGLGQDAALLALAGYHVTAVERSPVLFALLEDGLWRAMTEPALGEVFANRFKVIEGDARTILVSGEISADAVYIDPMFPPKRKASALANKRVRLIRKLVGDDPDASELLAIARQHSRRVILKRPDHVPPLAADVTVTFPGKLVRYDVYVQP